jgi:hypothetical protein
MPSRPPRTAEFAASAGDENTDNEDALYSLYVEGQEGAEKIIPAAKGRRGPARQAGQNLSAYRNVPRSLKQLPDKPALSGEKAPIQLMRPGQALFLNCTEKTRTGDQRTMAEQETAQYARCVIQACRASCKM